MVRVSEACAVRLTEKHFSPENSPPTTHRCKCKNSIVILDWNDGEGFIRNEMDSDLVQKAAAMNMTVELEKGYFGSDQFDRMTIGF